MFTCKSVNRQTPRFLVATARIEPLPRGPEMGIEKIGVAAVAIYVELTGDEPARVDWCANCVAHLRILNSPGHGLFVHIAVVKCRGHDRHDDAAEDSDQQEQD